MEIEVECSCGEYIDVDDIDTHLYSEDWTPVVVKCECGAEYEVHLHMDIIKDAPKALK